MRCRYSYCFYYLGKIRPKKEIATELVSKYKENNCITLQDLFDKMVKLLVSSFASTCSGLTK